jgi:DNA-directed RNA polymerase specialized sigma subunit
MIKLNVNNKVVEKNREISLEELANELKVVAYCAKVNNRIRELSYVVKKDCDIEFLDLFYVDNKKLTEKEVAKILGVSQQAVSKRLNKIKNKLKKF